MISRRRFLLIACAAAATRGQAAAPSRWQGVALGAEVSMEIHGPASAAAAALKEARDLIHHVENLFSLYDPNSALSHLNSTGRLDRPHADMLALFDWSSRLHALTEGLFDPTVQSLWPGLRDGGAQNSVPSRVGWHKVHHNVSEIVLEPGQHLTFNGIAQGFATDLVADALRKAGFTDIHVNIGERAARGRPRRLALEDPAHGYVGPVTLANGAVATSSPLATPIGSHGHILSPAGSAPHWSTVCVLASSATLADGLSTALCLADLSQARRIHSASGARRTLLVDTAGDLLTLAD